MTLLGIEIGGSKQQIVVGDASGAILHRRRLVVERVFGAEAIRASIATAVGELRQRHSWNAVGCGYGGPVDWTSGKIRCSHHVEGWNDFPLADWLREVCGAPAKVDNDSNVAALGEARFGAGRGFDPVFYTNSGSGVGGGLVTAGRIYHGAPPGEAELGHLRLDKSGGIVEDRCSGWSVDRKVRAAIQSDHAGVLAQLAGGNERIEGGEAKLLPEALRRGDATAHRLVRETADDLALALSHATHLLHPQIIVLGGGLALIGEPWRAAVAEALPGYVMGAFAPGPQVRLLALGEDVVPAGALALAALAE